jgi:hypothetical protein
MPQLPASLPSAVAMRVLRPGRTAAARYAAFRAGRRANDLLLPVVPSVSQLSFRPRGTNWRRVLGFRPRRCLPHDRLIIRGVIFLWYVAAYMMACNVSCCASISAIGVQWRVAGARWPRPRFNRVTCPAPAHHPPSDEAVS